MLNCEPAVAAAYLRWLHGALPAEGHPASPALARRAALALIVAAVALLLAVAGAAQLTLVAFAAIGVCAVLAGACWLLASRSVLRWIVLVLVVAAPVVILVAFARGSLLWVAVAAVALMLLAAGTARAALTTGGQNGAMPTAQGCTSAGLHGAVWWRRPVASFPLPAAAAGAGVVAGAPGVASAVPVPHAGGVGTLAEQAGHDPHGLVDVPEEPLVAGAQVVQAGLAVRGGEEPVLGAAAVACEPDVASPAVRGQGAGLGLPEGGLLR